jgi:hypothetical protein
MRRALVALFVSGGLFVASRARAQEANPPVSVPSSHSLLGPHRILGDIDMAKVQVDASQLPESLILSPDGKTLYTLESGGLLRIGLPGFREQVRLDVGRKCGGLALSGEGLPVTVTGSRQVWLVDGTSFLVKARMDVPEVMQALSAPTLALDDAPTLYVLDFKTGTRGRRWMVADLDEPISFRSPLVTHDGVYLLASGWGQVFRFRIAERDIDLVEARPLATDSGPLNRTLQPASAESAPAGRDDAGSGVPAVAIPSPNRRHSRPCWRRPCPSHRRVCHEHNLGPSSPLAIPLPRGGNVLRSLDDEPGPRCA